MHNAITMSYNDVMQTLTVKLYKSDDFGYLDDMINIAGIIYNTALTIIQDLSVREWTCPECGAEHDRDMNAAVNILAEAKRIAKQGK